MNELVTGARDTDDLSSGLDRDRNERQREFSKNRIIYGNYRLRKYAKGYIRFPEHQEKAT